ncbi:MAG: hypothetical protein JSR89_05050 [Proteobacteria bacterium]|nr:hypothetical protein [Pseudomonadota bacterium]
MMSYTTHVAQSLCSKINLDVIDAAVDERPGEPITLPDDWIVGFLTETDGKLTFSDKPSSPPWKTIDRGDIRRIEIYKVFRGDVEGSSNVMLVGIYFNAPLTAAEFYSC